MSLQDVYPCRVAVLLVGIAALSVPASAAADSSAPDSSVIMPGGKDGTVFDDMTIQGEDRIRIVFERPSLDLELDPKTAPGLDWGEARDVLNRSGLDFLSPFLRVSTRQHSPFLGRPWLSGFAAGAVARFHPDVDGVDQWVLTVADSRGETVARFEGKGKVPEEIAWDGRSLAGSPVPPGLTYSYVFEATDRAGNQRSFLGDGFELPSYRLQTESGISMQFSGRELGNTSPTRPDKATPPSILLETASWINQLDRGDGSIRLEATARTFQESKALSDRVMGGLVPLLMGDPARIQLLTTVQPDAPESGNVTLTLER